MFVSLTLLHANCLDQWLKFGSSLANHFEAVCVFGVKAENEQKKTQNA